MNDLCKLRYFDSVSLAVCCASHFAVDMGCFYILFAFVSPAYSAADVTLAFLLYNCAAFGLQPLFGILADRRPALPLGALGALLTALALGCGALPALALALCALGNALFHVAGGRYSLTSSLGRVSRPGLFVSTGALGVACGTFLGRGGAGALLPLGVIAVCFALTAAIELSSAKRALPSAKAASARYQIAAPLPLIALLSLPLAAITVRSYVGFIIPMDWKTTAALAFVPALASFAGKAAGGFLADRFGARATAAALVLSVPALCCGAQNALLCAAGIFLFNIAMPVSLCTLASALPGREGLAFGLSTLALLIGSIPPFAFAVSGAAKALIIALTLAAAACTYLSTNNRRFQK